MSFPLVCAVFVKMGKSIDEILSRDNGAFNNYVFYSSFLIIKMLMMSPLTGFQRYRTKVFVGNFSGRIEILNMISFLKTFCLLSFCLHLNFRWNPETIVSDR